MVVVFSLFLLLGLLMSCDAKYEDVSTAFGFVERVGEACVVNDEVRVHGIRKDYETMEKITGYIVITPKPGIGGREVTFQETLSAGTVLTIAGVRRCSNCLESRVDFLVTSPSLSAHRQYQIWAREEVLSPGASQCQKPGAHR